MCSLCQIESKNSVPTLQLLLLLFLLRLLCFRETPWNLFSINSGFIFFFSFYIYYSSSPWPCRVVGATDNFVARFKVNETGDALPIR